jgi:hypothetical protein
MMPTAPSSYVGLDGRRRSYVWDQEILPNRSNLRALPPWLIEIINASDTPVSAPRRVALYTVRSKRNEKSGHLRQ